MTAARGERDPTALLRAEIRRSQALAGAVAWTAGQVADIEDDVAATLEYMARMASAARAEVLRARAEHARSFAARERREQAHWQRVNDES